MSPEKNMWAEDDVARHVRGYFAAAQRPLIIGLAGVTFLYLLSSISFLEWEQDILQWLARLVIVAMLVRISYAVAERQSDQLSHAVTASLLAGVVLGLWHGVFNLIWFPSWWAVLGLVSECLGGGIVGGFIGLLFAVLGRWRQKSLTTVQSTEEPAGVTTMPSVTAPTPASTESITKSYGENHEDTTQPSHEEAPTKTPARRRRSSRQQ